MTSTQPLRAAYPDPTRNRYRATATVAGIDIAERVLALRLSDVSRELADALAAGDVANIDLCRRQADRLAHVLFNGSAAGGSWIKRLRGAAKTAGDKGEGVPIDEAFVDLLLKAHDATSITTPEVVALQRSIADGRPGGRRAPVGSAA
jgi:hypothetical protein